MSYSDTRRDWTPRMVDFLDLTASGKTAREIAAARHVSVRTVDQIRLEAVRRKGARNLYEAVAMRARGEL